MSSTRVSLCSGLVRLAFIGGAGVLLSCSTRHAQPKVPSAPAATRVPRYVPPADRYLSSVLLNFDSPQDAAFIDAAEVRLGAGDGGSANNRALVVSKPTSIKLGALVRGRDFPGPWDLIGLRVRSERGGTVRVGLGGTDAAIARPVEVSLRAGVWTLVWLESPPPMSTTAPTGDHDALRLDVQPVGSAVSIDDVMLAQGRIVVADSRVPQSGERWQVRREARLWQVRVNETTIFTLPAAPFVDGGFAMLEATPVRVVLTSPTRTVAIDRLGRLIDGGVARVDPGLARYAKTTAENASPAAIEIVSPDGRDDAGRVERALPGDRDNDGYDESRGCYSVRAVGDRITLRLSRRNGPVRWPVVEVYDLPPGEVSVYVEGQIVPWTTRLTDGRVVVELPLDLQRPIAVQVRIK